MSDSAHEAMERHEHLAHASQDHHGRRTALLIGILAAVLALCEMAERSSQNAYLSHHISASDEFAFYQARQTRAMILNQSAVTIDLLSDSPAAAKASAAARAEAARLTEDSDRGNGGRQIQARAAAETAARDTSLHRYEWFELVTSGLQIAIVLASVSVVTRLPAVAYAGAGLGAVAAGLALLVVGGLV